MSLHERLQRYAARSAFLQRFSDASGLSFVEQPDPLFRTLMQKLDELRSRPVSDRAAALDTVRDWLGQHSDGILLWVRGGGAFCGEAAFYASHLQELDATNGNLMLSNVDVTAGITSLKREYDYAIKQW